MNNPLESVNTPSLSVFNFHSQPVRLLTQNHEPWFIAKDVCKAVEIRNTSHALLRLDDDEKDKFVLNDSIGRKRNTVIVSESGMYALVLSSRKPSAKAFRKWVTSEVLPAIRKTGSYFQAQQPIAPAETNDDDYYKHYGYDDLDAPEDLDALFAKVDYIFDQFPYDCREELTVERQKQRVIQELVSAFPKDKKFLLSRDCAIGVAEAERYFTIDQLADRFERMIFEPMHGDDIVNLLDKMNYIKASEDADDEVTVTKSGKFHTQRIAGQIKWRCNILPLLLREYRWQLEHKDD